MRTVGSVDLVKNYFTGWNGKDREQNVGRSFPKTLRNGTYGRCDVEVSSGRGPSQVPSYTVDQPSSRKRSFVTFEFGVSGSGWTQKSFRVSF